MYGGSNQYLWKLDVIPTYTAHLDQNIVPAMDELMSQHNHQKFFKTIIGFPGTAPATHSALFYETDALFYIDNNGLAMQTSTSASPKTVSTRKNLYFIGYRALLYNEYRVAFWPAFEDPVGYNWVNLLNTTVADSLIIGSRFVTDDVAVFVNITNEWYAVLNYVLYTESQRPKLQNQVVTTLYDPRKVFIFNTRIAILAYTPQSDPGENKIWVAENPLDPVNPILLDLPYNIYKTKIMYDNLFIITNTEVRYSNDGVSWKSILVPNLSGGMLNNYISTFSFNSRVYLNVEEYSISDKGIFYSDILS
jgi:hypothetical protein